MEKYLANNMILQNKADLLDAAKAPIVNGRYIVVEETRELYYDTNNSRMKMRDIQMLETEADRQALTSAVNDDMFYVKESNKIYYYSNGQFVECNKTVYIGTTEPTDPGVELWINPEGAIISVEDTLTSTSVVNALSANQGRVLNEKIEAIEASLEVTRI